MRDPAEPSGQEGPLRVRSLAYFATPRPWGSLALALLMVATLFAQVALVRADRELYEAAFVRTLDWQSAPWTIVTSLLAHKGWHHLRDNLVGLVVLAPLVERWLGRGWLFGVFLGAGAVAGLLGLYYEAFARPDRVASSLGASGAIWAFMGMVLVVVPAIWRRAWRDRAGDMTRWRALGAFVFTPRAHELVALAVVAVQLVGLVQWAPESALVGRVGNAAHLAGLLIGLGFGWWRLRRRGLGSLDVPP